MHIVLVTHYFPPEVNAPARRSYDHAKYWVEAGHQVTIVTANPSHPYGRLYDGYENVTQEERIDGIRVLRLRTRFGANAGVVARSFNYASFFLAVWRHRKLVGHADAVISTSPQFLCGLSGVFVARANQAVWVLEIRDIWPESIVAVGAAKPSPLTRGLAWLARRAYATADHIVSVSPGFAEHFDEAGVTSSKLTVIPNGVTVDEKTCTERPDSASEDPAKVIIAYIGTIGMAHGLTTVLNAIEALSPREDIQFVIAGSGAQADLVARTIRERALKNVKFVGQLSRSEVDDLWSSVDASIIHLKNQPTFEKVIPTKLLEAMSVGKPVVLGVGGVAAGILSEAGAGLIVPAEDPKAMAKAIKELADDEKVRVEMGARGRAYVRRHFSRVDMAQRYVELVQGLVQRP